MGRKPLIFAACAILILSGLLIWNMRRGPTVLSAGAPLPSGSVQPQLVSASGNGVLLARDGSLWVWGGAQSSLIAVFGKLVISRVPLRVGKDRDWWKVAANHSDMLAIKRNGSLWGWGSQQQRWNESPNMVSVGPAPIDSDKDWSDIVMGANHRMALKQDGSLWTWGGNAYGQLGNGSTEDERIPTRVGRDHWTAIAAGAFNSYAVRYDGTLWGWGLDARGGGRTNNNLAPVLIDTNSDWVAISASSYCLLALKSDGSLWLRGQNAPHTIPSCVTNPAVFTRIGSDSDWTRIHGGEMHFFAQKTDGTWWVCGANFEGQLGLGSGPSVSPSQRPSPTPTVSATPRPDVVKIDPPRRLPYSFDPWAMDLSFDRSTTLILLKDGTLWSCGIRLGQPKPSRRFDGIKARLNRYLPHLRGRPFFPIRQYESDTTPRRIWHLPSEVVASLSESKTNASK